MRIVAGSARGRPLVGPRGEGLRPTSDRVRETLFNVIGPWLTGRVLDLYAGTGALGIEALSRGADFAVLVDSGKEAQQLCRRNLEALGFAQQAEVLPLAADRALGVLEGRGERFQTIFADPPYAARANAWLLERLGSSPLLSPEGVLVVETDKWEEPPPTAGPLAQVDERKLGDTRLRLYRWAARPA